MPALKHVITRILVHVDVISTHQCGEAGQKEACVGEKAEEGSWGACKGSVI